jgi:hypothetical protein
LSLGAGRCTRKARKRESGARSPRRLGPSAMQATFHKIGSIHYQKMTIRKAPALPRYCAAMHSRTYVQWIIGSLALLAGLQVQAQVPGIEISRYGERLGSHRSVSDIACAPGLTRPVVLRVHAVSTAALGNLSATLSDDVAGEFIIAHALPTSIAAGSSASLVLAYAPQAAHLSTATLTISSDDPMMPRFTVFLAGTAMQYGPVIAARRPNGDELPFGSSLRNGSNQLNTITSNDSVVVTNYGNQDAVGLDLRWAQNSSNQLSSKPAWNLSAADLPIGASVTLTPGYGSTPIFGSSGTLELTANGGSPIADLAVHNPISLNLGGSIIVAPPPSGESIRSSVHPRPSPWPGAWVRMTPRSASQGTPSPALARTSF